MHNLPSPQVTYSIVGEKSDLWRYDVNNNLWTWMTGNSTPKEPGNYGEKGKTSPESYPGSRYGASAWYDSSRRELWLFGGWGIGTDNESAGTFRNMSIIA